MTAGLDANAVLARAQTETGLYDYGDPTLPERFCLAVDHLNGIGMDANGIEQAESVCHWLLTSRLEFIEDRNRYPIAAEVIDHPMFVTGEPRSGTTLMHVLMAVDPHARALRFWEVMYPSPPPGLARPDDPRRARADADWREINAKMPKWLLSHPYNDMLGDGLPEDERSWAFDFRVMTPTAWWRVPMQTLVAGLPTDSVAQYRLHMAMLQQLQYNRPPKYWVLKGFHGFRLKEFFDTYPDANLLWLHRDPAQVAASRTMMIADILDGIVGPIDLAVEAKKHLEMSRQARVQGFQCDLRPTACRRISLSHPESGAGLRSGPRNPRPPLSADSLLLQPNPQTGRRLRGFHLPTGLDRRPIRLPHNRNTRHSHVFQHHRAGGASRRSACPA
ncbi:MAG TPA: sulfotransferase [Mycobacterium sp.]|nr:sulfotransferase [Mycobacterium sp.]HTX96757.1 sulfotransferase [Mycobacterium sp.]